MRHLRYQSFRDLLSVRAGDVLRGTAGSITSSSRRFWNRWFGNGSTRVDGPAGLGYSRDADSGDGTSDRTQPNLGTQAGATDGEMVAQPKAIPGTVNPSLFDPRYSEIDYGNISTAGDHQWIEPRNLNEKLLRDQVN